VCSGFKGGDRSKFSDVILAVATAFVIDILVYFVLGIALIPSMGSYQGLNSAAIISILVAGIIVGYVFAIKISARALATARPMTLYFDMKSMNSLHMPLGTAAGGAGLGSSSVRIFFNSSSISSSFAKITLPSISFQLARFITIAPWTRAKT
jgi:hypothetical protein